MITEEELKKLQKLAKLSFSKDELDNFAKKLNSVMAMIDSLVEVNCENIEPLRSVSDMYQRTREDEVNVGNISNQLFANVPAKNAEFAKEVKCFIVPKMVE
ncbi:MAG: Asp-tRNA(Asn)/Glu-tRNA(Gln) amidotransferase subunit GatC [Rickettsiaceae bacterium]|jgi:aspartyl-tRNA(Asn)/glutamyl-tRNA(Gln) amidotransferase subunit C|nr:Asp-tRNA(Asn)/Glu-tRNA(Gln) amidotransferase subunit GatC [Rickettsiales bacterium]MCP5362602.1 Asp-tRNA(Asn)/Glu-tRNA(Gln) amidotransferase subunit GatC [Rickettsiaceae bacterium]MCP5374774.1 Asp-tRNA(Asn)/Glu-tRNA(Gln) amidotransferase subunit GatC [Rickettsiaceae bacterium]MCP5378707.1 Asp-tRNA(Asn)/Glu-tRNA(Gln) amidotransferase subunit GatC [Rickettsiaceae bacterium]WPX98603.1 Aspartyl/glutamyl-tRNA(Asn/Gln) amidotransferase subunit C [Candidatus Megaera polyxenophila]